LGQAEVQARSREADVQGTKTSARVEQIVRSAQQANVLLISRAAFGKRLHVIELDKPPRGTAPAVCETKAHCPPSRTYAVRRTATGKYRPRASGRTQLVCRFMAGRLRPAGSLRLAERRPEGAWAPSFIARVRRVARLDADPEASLLLSVDEASRQELDQAPEIALGESMTGELAGAFEQIAQLGISGEVYPKAVG